MDWNEIILWLFGGGTILAIVGSIVLSILCTFVPMAGIGWFVYSRWKKGSDVLQASQRWLSTTGKVTKSRVEVSGGEITSVMPRVIYEYMVGAREYQGDQIRAGGKYWDARTSRDSYDTIDRYPEGATVRVYYNPVTKSLF